jgi:butyryl-CoA dehydrogenase/short/branched chain acyl-CoA dehydrogenase
MPLAEERAETAAQPLTALSEEERFFQTTVRKFAREQIRPYVREMDETCAFRKDIIRQFFEMGLMGIEIPEEYGGQGGSFFQAVLAVEELSAVDPSAGVIVDVQNTICNNALIRWATPAQKAKYLPRLASDTVASYALSEAGSGSDAFAMATRAEDRGDHFLLTGRKLWITNAAESGLFLLFANAMPDAGYKGVTAFLIEREFPGFQVGKKEDKLGLRASSTCELILDNCRVPTENILGEVGKGYKVAIETLNEGRIAIGAQMIGLARAALEHAVAYARDRKQF